MKQGIVTMLDLGRMGRMANQMYQISGILGIGRKLNLEPLFPVWRNIDHQERFGSNEDCGLFKHFVHQLPGIPEGTVFQPERWVDWGYHDVRLPPGNWNLKGHFQAPAYFDHVRDTVAHYFRMVNEPEQNDCTSIHVRLTDYDNAYHPRLALSYYKPAMDLFPAGRFLIFSDDIPACKEMFGSDVEYVEGLDYIQSFKLMKRCHSFIIGNSSYSAMAATLGDHPDKRVVAPRPWFGPAYCSIDAEELYDKDWTVINWQ